MLAIIGGSGLTKLPELEITERKIVRTPYGLTSSPICSAGWGAWTLFSLHDTASAIPSRRMKSTTAPISGALHSLGV